MNKIISEDFADLIIVNELVPQYVNSEKDNVIRLNNKHSLVNLPVAEFDKCSIGKYNYNLIPSLFTLNATESLEQSGIIEIQKNPNFALFGEGIIVAFIDTGIDYQHQAFKNADNTTRILSIWDQTITNESAPPGEMPYGTVYTKEMIDAALKTSTPTSTVPTVDEIGHGTILAGITAGNVNEDEKFSGVVPKADIVVVKLKQPKKITRDLFLVPQTAICFQDSDILMGLNYVMSVSERLNKPIAICIGIGTSQGGHDGLGSVSSQLDVLSQMARTGVAVSAGNEGISRRHYYGIMKKNEPTKDFELNVSAKDVGISMEIWQQAPYRIGLDITSPTGEYTAPIFPGISECRKLTYIFESSVLWVNNFLIEGDTGDQLILVRLQNAQPGIWKFKVYNVDNAASEFNIWLPSGPLISDETYFVQSNPDKTITSPGNAIKPITITSYSTQTNGIAINASRGYTRSNVIKPDLAAPGVDITCPLVGNRYGTSSGSSCAAAITTGVIAMMLEWGYSKGRYPSINGQDIKKLLIRGAKRTDDIEYPNNVWGFGKINIYNVFQRLT